MTSPIDLSRLPAPNAIEPLSYDALFTAFRTKFEELWEAERVLDPTLPSYDVGGLETDPAMIVGQAWSFLRLLDRARVNDAVKSVLAVFARNTDLDHVVARQGVIRLETAPADPLAGTAAVMETDEQLLRRYMLSFGRAAAGSVDRILYDAYSAWPAMADAAVNGWAVHGRRGETDLVITGTDGVTPADKLVLVRAAVTAPDSKVEAIGMAVLPAVPLFYAVSQTIEIPVGPDAELVRGEAAARVATAADARHVIGGTVQRDLLAGAAFGPSVSDVAHLAPAADVVATRYQVPVRSGLTVEVLP